MLVSEHLVLKQGGFLGTKFKTKYHDDLGDDLQRALDVLEQEGWEVVTSHHTTSGTTELILKRKPR